MQALSRPAVEDQVVVGPGVVALLLVRREVAAVDAVEERAVEAGRGERRAFPREFGREVEERKRRLVTGAGVVAAPPGEEPGRALPLKLLARCANFRVSPGIFMLDFCENVFTIVFTHQGAFQHAHQF